MEQPTYAQSMQEAKGHGQAFLRSTIGQHPTATAVVMAVLVVLILVLGYYVAHYRAKCGKSGFHIAPLGNLGTGNNNPLWQYGAMDAGNWGPIHREPTAYNVAAYHAGWRSPSPALREGFGPAPGCGAGWDPAASAEAEALATVGGLQPGSSGYDSSVGLSDDQLVTLMHQGGAP
jgi:hypothetical protein